MFPAMETNRQNTTTKASGFDAQVGALLDRVQETASFVDSLMEMPVPTGSQGSGSSEWDAAVARRLESRLARTMRALIEKEPERKTA